MSTAPEHRHEPVGYLELLQQNRNFRLLWFSQIVSLLGDWFDLIASAALLAQFTNSGGAIGGLFVVRMLVPFLVSPLAGIAADRFNRKTLLIVTDVVRGFVVLLFLFVRRPEQAWMLYVITALQVALTGFWFPTRSAILPDVVSRRELGAANAIASATWSVMLSLGAALGGLAAGRWGVYPSFIIDGLTFFISAAIVARISYHHVPPLHAAQRSLGGVMTQYVEGLRYLQHHRDVLFVSLHKAANGLIVSAPFQVAQVIIAEQIFVIGEGGAGGLGWMYAVVGLGTGLGPIFVRRFTGDRDRPLRIAIAASYAMTAVGLALAALLTDFNLVLVGSMLRGVGLGIGWVFSTQLLLFLTPDRVRGRVFATEFALMTLAQAIGALLAGWLLDLPGFGVSTLLWASAALILIPGALWAMWIYGKGQQPALAISEESPD